MATKIITKNGSGTPATGALDTGELAVDLTNAKLFTSTDGTDVVQVGGFDGDFDNGSASAPSLTFGGFATSGLFGFGTTNAYGFATGGACVMAMNPLSGVYFTGGLNSYDPADSDPHIWVRANGLAGMLFYSTANPLGFFNTSGSQVGSISIVGGSSGTSTAYNTSSDYRLKTDIQPMTDVISRVKAINAVNFQWISNGTRTDGFIAHELATVVPEAVTGDKDATYYDEKTETTKPLYQGVDQSKLVPLLVAAVQELTARIETLEGA